MGLCLFCQTAWADEVQDRNDSTVHKLRIKKLELSGQNLSDINLRSAPELMYLDCRNNGMRLSTVHSLLSARNEKAAYYFNPQKIASKKYMELGEEWDLRSEFTINGDSSNYVLYDYADKEVPAEAYTLQNGILRIQRQGSYRLELTNRGVTDYTENGEAGDLVTVLYEMAVGSYTVRVQTEDSAKGTVSGGGVYFWDDVFTVTATPNIGYGFSHWEKDGNHFSSEQVFSSTINENWDLTAYFKQNEYIVNVRSGDLKGGTVSGGGTYKYGDSVIITATPNPGYGFSHWENSESYFSWDSVCKFLVTEDCDMVAYFYKATDNEDMREYDGINIYAKDKVIYLSQEVGEVKVFTVGGQLVYSGADTAIPVKDQGLYIVQIGSYGRKVMVW